jgi:hypothetical protein
MTKVVIEATVTDLYWSAKASDWVWRRSDATVYTDAADLPRTLPDPCSNVDLEINDEPIILGDTAWFLPDDDCEMAETYAVQEVP